MILLPPPQIGCIDKRQTMYPSIAFRTEGKDTVNVPPFATAYGIVMQGTVEVSACKTAQPGEYFCITNPSPASLTIPVSGNVAFFIRLGYLGQNLLGGPIDESGRLVYIDGCSDSLLVYPPRKGDPSLNHLYFPPKVEQSFHIHPSLRFGCVLAGKGYAELGDGKIIPLEVGSVFCIEERERHRFVTKGDSMTVIAYHPDGDWGPEDHNHTMLNRTYVTK